MGQKTFEDNARSEWQMKLKMENKLALAEELVLSDRHLKLKEIAEMSKLSDTIVCRILRNQFNIHKVSAI